MPNLTLVKPQETVLLNPIDLICEFVLDNLISSISEMIPLLSFLISILLFFCNIATDHLTSLILHPKKGTVIKN